MESCGHASSVFEVTAGPCTVELVNGASCVGRPSGYSPNEQCTISASGPAALSCITFDTESNFDFLHVDGSAFSGERCPIGAEITAVSEITWSSDGSVQGGGWKVCAGPSVGACQLGSLRYRTNFEDVATGCFGPGGSYRMAQFSNIWVFLTSVTSDSPIDFMVRSQHITDIRACALSCNLQRDRCWGTLARTGLAP